MSTTGWGGRRAGAGRKRKDGRIGPTVPHVPRPTLRRGVPAHDPRGFESTMQGLGIRLARQLNRLMGRKGKFFYDRFEVSSPALKI